MQTRKSGNMQAIKTKYIGPTNTKPGRIKATCDGGTITLLWDFDLCSGGNHASAATTLQSKMGWDYTRLICGWIGDECYWVPNK